MAGRALLEIAARPHLPAPAPSPRAVVTARQLIVPIGTWHHPVYGTYALSRERVERFYDLYRAGVRRMKLPDPPGGEGLMLSELHQLDGRAMGYLSDPALTERGIEATITFSDRGLQALAAGELTHLSPEFLPEYTDPETGQRYRDVWNGAGQVARGFLDLPAITIAFGDDTAGLVAFGDPERLPGPLDGPAERSGMENVMTSAPTTQPHQQAGAVPDEATVKDETIKATPDEETVDEETADEAPVDETVEPHQQVGALQPHQQAGALEAPAETFSDRHRIEVLEQELAVERRGRLEGACREELRTINFGDPQQPLALAPASRETLAVELAQLEPERARRILEAIKAQRFYHPGVIGFDDPARVEAAAADRPLTEADRAAARAAGLTEEQYRRGMNRAG